MPDSRTAPLFADLPTRRAQSAPLRKPAARAAQEWCALMRAAVDPGEKRYYHARMIEALLALDETRGSH